MFESRLVHQNIMRREFRQDIIYEKITQTSEVRTRLANALRQRRKLFTSIGGSPYTMIEVNKEIEVLKWVLNHSTSVEQFYRETYGREVPRE